MDLENSTPPPKSPDWDARELIKRAGGCVAIRRNTKALGYRVPSAPQVYMWQNRQRVPSEWVAVLLLLAEARGEVVAPKEVIKNIVTNPGADLLRFPARENHTPSSDPFT